MDEKWKLGKKGSRNASSSSSSSSSNPSMRRCSSITGRVAGEAMLKRSESVPARSKFSRKCSSMVKEQRAKFYIVRRCVTMLVCWKDYRDT